MKLCKIILTTLLCCLVVLSSVNCIFAENNTDIKFGKEQQVLISGKLGGEYADQTITFIVTKKNVGLSDLQKEDLYYVDELLTDENGYYELLFNIPQAVGADFDVWVNECGELAEICTVADYSERIYIEAAVDYVRNGEVYDLTASLRNVFGYDKAVYDLFTAFYYNDILMDVEIDSIDLSNTNEERNYEKSVNVPDGGENEPDKIKFFILKRDNIQPLIPAKTLYDHSTDHDFVKFSEDTYIKYDDPDYGNLLKFVGRWQENEAKTANVGYWTRPYLEIRTESDSMKIHFGEEETKEGNGVYLYINNEFICGLSADSGKTQELGPYIKKYGNGDINDVKIIATHENKPIFISGITAGAGTKIYKPKEKKKILFSGASMTSGWPGFSTLIPMELDYDFTTISRSGSSLSSEVGVNLYPYNQWGIYDSGMSQQFDRLQTFRRIESYDDSHNPIYVQGLGKGGVDAYDATKDHYDIVFLNMIYNDEVYNEANRNAFMQNYVSFINKMRTYYPDAKVVVLGPFKSNPQSEEQKAKFEYRNETVKMMKDNGDFNIPNVYYIDAAEWELAYKDDLHLKTDDPNGYPKATRLILDEMKAQGIIE